MEVNHATQYQRVAPVSLDGLTATIKTHEAHGTVRHFDYGEAASLVFRVRVSGAENETVRVVLGADGKISGGQPESWRNNAVAKAARAAVEAYCRANRLM